MSDFAQYNPAHSGFGTGSIITITGGTGVGKTTLGAGIAPDTRMAYIDGEGSGRAMFANRKPAMHFDVDMDLSSKHGSDYGAAEYVDYLDNVVAQVLANKDQVDVVVWDNPDPYMKDLVAHIEQQPGQYGLSAAQIARGALKYGARNEKISKITRQLASVGALVLIVHIKDEWNNQGPTGVVVPRTIKIWDELSTLTLWLVPGPTIHPPAALVYNKNRLAARVHVGVGKATKKSGTDFVADENLPVAVRAAAYRIAEAFEKEFGAYPDAGRTFNIPLLPPRIPVAEWEHIRGVKVGDNFVGGYFNNPPDLSALKPEEVPSDREKALLQGVLSPEQKEMLEVQKAQLEADRRELETLKAERIAEMKVIMKEYGLDDDDKKAVAELIGPYKPESDEIHLSWVKGLTARGVEKREAQPA